MASELETIKSLSQFANLKAYYRFESGDLTTDSSGEEHTLTAISDPAENASGKFGGAVALDSNDCYSIVDHADLRPTGVFTIGAWVKGSAGTTVRTIWSSFTTGGGKIYGFSLHAGTDEIPVMLVAKGTGSVNGTDYKTITGTTAVLDGTWHFVVGVWDGTYIRIYVDGAEDADEVAAFNTVYTTTNFHRIGARDPNGSSPAYLFTGSLDDVFLLNGTALSAAQIKAIYEGWILNASVGSFALTGFDIILKRAYKLIAGVGSFVLTGVSAGLTKAITLVAGTGSFILTGYDAILKQALNLICSVGEFTLTGYDIIIILKRTYTLIAETGTFILTGYSAILNRGYTLVAEAGEFILTGIDATFRRGINLIAETGVFSITINAITILINGTTTYFSKRIKPAVMTLLNRTKPTTNYSSRTKPETIWTERTKP